MTLYPTCRLRNPYRVLLILCTQAIESFVVAYSNSRLPSAYDVIMALLCLHFAIVSQLLTCL